MKPLRLALAAALAYLTATCAVTAPAFAADQPQPPPRPRGEMVLKIYPKLLPPQQGETIIQDPRSVNRHLPEDGLSPSPFEAAKDTRTWA